MSSAVPTPRRAFSAVAHARSIRFTILLAFAVVLALFGFAMARTLTTLEQLAAARAESAKANEARVAGHVAASLVREQYIHQAHTIIESNHSHLGHYEEVLSKTSRAVLALRNAASDAEERQAAESIVASSRTLDDQFKRTVVPAVEHADRATARRLHAETEKLVNHVVSVNERLNDRLAAKAARALEMEATLAAELKRHVLLCFAIALAVSLAVAVIVSHRVLTRLSLLHAGAQQLAAGNLGTRIPVSGHDEFTDLANAFNHMATEIENQQLERIRHETLAAIGQVAAGVAHEINNPLSVILGYAGILQKRGTLGDTEAHAVGTIADEARQCREIVRELLELARPPNAVRKPVDVGFVVRDCVAKLEESGASAGVKFAVSTDPKAIVHGHELELRRLVNNLLVNAIEASTPAASVDVRVANSDNQVRIEVQDHGSGISPEVMPRLLEPFFTTKESGTGLGLAIANRVAQAHGGQIDITSRPNAGTRVSVALKRQAPGNA